ncbi:MAG: coenzyme F420-0:L-glutamate ligase [Alphaproteobacteria bacterium]|nr:coenzyme F420-0:L-glutamate ligase [Alphaproteobacteria bacterium]
MLNQETTRYVGTSVYGIRMPIITKGDDILNIITNNVLESQNSSYQPISINNGDIIGITESFLARSQGNYVSLEDIAKDISKKFPKGDIGVAFPILSRNRFAKILEGIAKGTEGKVYVFLSYPSDEVGNAIMDEEKLYDSDINPHKDIITKQDFRSKFGTFHHPITGSDHIKMYEDISPKIEVILLNNPKDILKYTKQVIVASIHIRKRQKSILEKEGATAYTLDEILNTPSDTHGWSEYGVLGSNYANEDMLKLFPRDSFEFCKSLQSLIKKKTGKHLEVMIYGDGGFKCPKTKIWEFADPVVSPGYTDGLKGMPKEIKIKAVADNNINNPQQAIKDAIKSKNSSDDFYSIGTTPRQITDLLGSLCDLTTGSGEKGTPVVYIKGYFDNYLTQNPKD